MEVVQVGSGQVQHRNEAEESTAALVADLSAGVAFLRTCVHRSSNSSQPYTTLLQVLGVFEETILADSDSCHEITRILASLGSCLPGEGETCA